MRLVLKTLGALTLLAAVVIAGPLVTIAFTSSGVSEDGSLRSKIGREALRDAGIMCLDHPIAAAMTPRLTLRWLQIVDASSEIVSQPFRRNATIEALQKQLQGNGVASLTAAPPQQFRYRAEVAKYSWFAIPAGTIRIAEGSATCR